MRADDLDHLLPPGPPRPPGPPPLPVRPAPGGGGAAAFPAGLAGDRLGAGGVLAAVMAAAAPLTVVAGVVTTAYAVTGTLGLPAAFLVVAVVLVVFSAGYVAMSRHLPHAGAFYAYASAGLGRAAGVGAAWVSVAAYNSLQLGLYGLIGSATAPLVRDWAGIELPWWVSAVLAWGLVALLGVLRVEISGRVMTVLLACEVAVLCLYDVAWLAHPGAGPGGVATTLDWGLWSPARLLTSGGSLGAVLAIAVLGFVGFETTTVYAEEARDARRTVPAATYAAVLVIAVLYGVSAWAMATATGPASVADRARTAGPDLPFQLAGAHLGSGAVTVGHLLFATSVLAAMISFHSTTSRYLFALGREGVLPARFGRTSRTGAPRAGSLAQSGLGLAAIVIWAVAGWDPVLTLFYYLGTAGAFGVLVLLLTVALAVLGFFGPDRRGEPVWHTRIAPVLAAGGLTVMLWLVLDNYAGLLGVTEDSPLRWGIPATFALVAVAGCGYGALLRAHRPDVYARIGRGARAALPVTVTAPVSASADPAPGPWPGHEAGPR